MEIARPELTAEDIGVRLRAVRELSGLSVVQVAKASGVARREISAAEHGRRVLDAAALRAVAGALGVSPGVLVSAAPSAADDPLGDDPAPIPFDLPASERRINDATREDLEQSWIAVRSELAEVIEAATRLAMCGSDDDPTVLMRNVELEIDKVTRKRGFQRHVARHQAEVLEARAATPGTDPAA
jgi:transcriptional regulator with XRE-family HTH domain